MIQPVKSMRHHHVTNITPVATQSQLGLGGTAVRKDTVEPNLGGAGAW